MPLHLILNSGTGDLTHVYAAIPLHTELSLQLPVVTILGDFATDILLLRQSLTKLLVTSHSGTQMTLSLQLPEYLGTGMCHQAWLCYKYWIVAIRHWLPAHINSSSYLPIHLSILFTPSLFRNDNSLYATCFSKAPTRKHPFLNCNGVFLETWIPNCFPLQVIFWETEA